MSTKAGDHHGGRRGMASWHLQQINNSDSPAIPDEYVATNGPLAGFVLADGIPFQSFEPGCVFVSVCEDQQHFSYIDPNANIQDAWYDPSGWHIQQINNPGNPSIPGEYVATNGPVAATGRSPFISVYNGQQHFMYLDTHGNIQDAWYDPSGWHLQQINNPGNPSVRGEYVATNGPATDATPFVSVYNNQQHFTYLDNNSNIQDAWYDPSGWHLQQINNPGAPSLPGEYVATNGPVAYATLFVSTYNDQQHFTYIEANGNIQDAWYDPRGWHLQQINNPGAPSIPGEYVATNGPAARSDSSLFVAVYNNQQHFTYIDNNHNLQDAWWDGDANVWKLQQISNSKGPTIPDEYSATEGPEVARQVNASLFVSVYNNQQHFAYIDGNYNIQDAWWDGDTNVWKLQQINNSSNPTINGEYAATNGPPLAVGAVAICSLFVSVYNDQQDFTYVDNNGNIQDAWYG